MLNDGPISQHLQEQKNVYGDVEGWSFTSFDFQSLL